MGKRNRECEARFITQASSVGLSYQEIRQLMRDSMILHTWAEHECNGNIQRDEVTNKPYWYHGQDGPGPIRSYPIRDLETPAVKRIEAIAEAHGLVAIFQGDPRGWPVTLVGAGQANTERGIGVPV